MRIGLAVLWLGGAWWSAGPLGQVRGSVPTFNRDVAPILFAHCVDCHRPGGVGPMSLVTIDDARAFAEPIRHNPAPDAEVRFGPQSVDEMFTPFLEVSIDAENTRLRRLEEALR